MIDTPTRPGSTINTASTQTPMSRGAQDRPRRGRLWAMLHAQALLNGTWREADDIEDDWQRLSARRAR